MTRSRLSHSRRAQPGAGPLKPAERTPLRYLGVSLGWQNSYRPTGPGAHASDARNTYSRDISRRGTLHGREFHIRSDVDMRQLLQEVGRPTRLDRGLTVQNG